MPPSYRKIDYRVRPAKSIERKMLVESLRRLCEFGNLSSYRYIGFGSLYFADFVLFHKTLAFRSMVSIEKTLDPAVQRRFSLNVPYGNIEMRFGHSNGVLQTLDWAPRTVAWLDDDKPLSKECLRDVSYVAKNAASGSVIIVSVNAGNLDAFQIDNDDEGAENEGRPGLIEKLKRMVGDNAVPHDIKASDLSGWGVAASFRRIIDNEISDALRVRNERLPDGAKIRYQQLYNFIYSDDAKMVTVGGVFYDEGQEHILAKCSFSQLDFIRLDASQFHIETPLLTHLEMRQLDAQRTRQAAGLPLPQADIEKYEKTYRYYPNFVEAEIG